MNIKIVIPARYSSSRLPGKPLLEINEKPVVWHVVRRCVEAGFLLKDIVVATDDQRIFDVLATLDITAVMTSTEHQSGSDRIYEVASIFNWPDDTVVINVQGDEPLIPAALIKSIVNYAKDKPEFVITTAVTPITNIEEFTNPNVVKTILGHNGRALYFTRSASPFCRDNSVCLDLAFRHIGIYTYRVAALREFFSHPEAPLEAYEKLEQLRALNHGIPIGATIYLGDIPHGVDTLDDYQHVKRLMENN
ncbi:3-deoxy-manno-octulosonate cytidylyltransferase [Vibrio sp. Vb1337]|uniref:3-deoxy-manno-octulosonate cytidylyltransferase n=1 Tax=Vibrio sp. Vb1337 TaxID=3074641 RepID=UPI002963F96D|nr:3-deoxy-manno-octulosonate cytidylyltransferase [Vibrio sp. Vb1337]MDW1899924.1 3-deoxy-manno-octulosonate cytidylyltransferase [Vibrio sp. Vb1337]